MYSLKHPFKAKRKKSSLAFVTHLIIKMNNDASDQSRTENRMIATTSQTRGKSLSLMLH